MDSHDTMHLYCTKCNKMKPEQAFGRYVRPSNQLRLRQWCDLCTDYAGDMVSTVYRRDAWTQPEDQYLVVTVLRFIHEGRTQLQAFDEVGRVLSRTAGAVDHRWNHVLRKHWKDEIKAAKLNKSPLPR